MAETIQKRMKGSKMSKHVHFEFQLPGANDIMIEYIALR